eukprot:GHVO01061588.1.p2 GENE.GHVO01061588.1~~GHVO01061588.1.p2  ORF type:complete len:100 (-),score=3.27 GHVO01061588.1:287-586(-)
MCSQEGSYQALSNLKFLMVLKDPCHDLADGHPKDIPPMLPKILNLIRIIWVNSEFYKTRERLTGILRKVNHQAQEKRQTHFLEESVYSHMYQLHACSHS